MRHIKFYQTEIQKEILRTRIKADESLKRVFRRQKDMTIAIEKDINLRLNGMIDQFVTIFIEGKQGSQKSSCGMTIAKKFDKTFDETRIFFQYEEYQEEFVNSKPKQIRLMDEQVFQRGTGSNRLIQTFQEQIEVLRKRQNSLIIISPEMKYFDPKLFIYTFETIDNCILAVCKYNKKLHECRDCDCYIERISEIKEVYVRMIAKTEGFYIGFYIIKIDWNNDLWHKYGIKKDKFMQEIVEGKKSRADYEKIATEILANNDTSEYKNKKQLTLLVQRLKPNLTIGETDLVITSIQMQRKNN